VLAKLHRARFARAGAQQVGPVDDALADAGAHGGDEGGEGGGRGEDAVAGAVEGEVGGAVDGDEDGLVGEGVEDGLVGGFFVVVVVFAGVGKCWGSAVRPVNGGERVVE